MARGVPQLWVGESQTTRVCLMLLAYRGHVLCSGVYIFFNKRPPGTHPSTDVLELILEITLAKSQQRSYSSSEAF